MALESIVITFRETLEAALVVGIVLAYLYKIKQTKYNKLVYAGVAAGIAASIAAAIAFTLFASGFQGKAEQIFEGASMISAALLVSFMIIWMIKQGRHIRKETETRVQIAIEKGEKPELFLLPFIAVLREGIETVLFLSAIRYAGAKVGIEALLGMSGAIMLAYLIFAAAKKINLKHFFTATSIFLVMLAAGLAAHGVHEFQEAGLNVMTEEAWNLGNAVSEKGAVGGTLKALFGYNENPSILEAITYFAYLAAIAVLWKKIGRKKQNN